MQFARQIRKEADIATAAVGMITESKPANQIVESGDADFTLVARKSLADPYWPLHAARELGRMDAVRPPVQYGRAF